MIHTPGPWKYDDEWDTPAIWSGKPELGNVCDIIGEGVVSKADARRIVACVNACVGIPTEALEGMPSIHAHLKESS